MDRDNQRDKRLEEITKGIHFEKAWWYSACPDESTSQEDIDEAREDVEDRLFLLGEINRLRGERDMWNQAAEIQKDNNIAILSENSQLKGERDKAIKVLRWYAAKQTYMLGVNVTLSLNFPNQEPILTDKGDKARTILKELGVSGE